MRRPLSLRIRLLLAFLAVIAAALGTVGVAVLLVGPGYFAEAMGHVPGDPMGDAMAEATQAAFDDAMRQALVAATLIAIVAAAIVSFAVAGRIVRPITAVAAAARRIARGHYAERVPVTEGDEIGQLAGTFNAMAASLEATERRRIQLVGDVAHELRTPLATLDGYLEGLEDGVVTPDAATWQLLRGETARLTRLVADLSELWHAEAHEVPFHIEAVDVGALGREVAERFAPLAGTRVIEVTSSDPPVLALADRDRLSQIISNYVANAIRHGPDGSRITITGDRIDDLAQVSVADEGEGLAREELDAVFERFYRVDASRSRALGGSGIGLAIARALAEGMGGRVWADSAGPGQGATFHVELPGA
jgi:signal transduction histidine kinase